MKKSMLTAMTMLLCSGNAAFAALNPEAEAFGLMAQLFLSFLALLIVTQLIPGVLLLTSMLKGLFSRKTQGSERR